MAADIRFVVLLDVLGIDFEEQAQFFTQIQISKLEVASFWCAGVLGPDPGVFASQFLVFGNYILKRVLGDNRNVVDAGAMFFKPCFVNAVRNRLYQLDRKDGGYLCSSAVMFSTSQGVDEIIDDEGTKYGKYS